MPGALLGKAPRPTGPRSGERPPGRILPPSTAGGRHTPRAQPSEFHTRYVPRPGATSRTTSTLAGAPELEEPCASRRCMSWLSLCTPSSVPSPPGVKKAAWLSFCSGCAPRPADSHTEKFMLRRCQAITRPPPR